MGKMFFGITLFFLFCVFGAQEVISQPNLGTVVQEETQAMKAQLESKIQALIDAPDGVFDAEYEANGVVKRFKIKATMEVSTAFRGARADRLARENATRKVRAAFSTFLNSNVVFIESGNEGLQIVEKDKVETGQYTEASASSINVASQSFQRGLVPLMQRFEGEGADRVCIVVMGWSQKMVTASMQAEGSMKPAPANNANTTPKTVPTSPAQNQENRGTTTKLGNEDF